MVKRKSSRKSCDWSKWRTVLSKQNLVIFQLYLLDFCYMRSQFQSLSTLQSDSSDLSPSHSSFIQSCSNSKIKVRSGGEKVNNLILIVLKEFVSLSNHHLSFHVLVIDKSLATDRLIIDADHGLICKVRQFLNNRFQPIMLTLFILVLTD